MKSYKTACPVCGRDSFYITPSNGVGYCFRASCHYLQRDNKNESYEQKRSDNVYAIRQYYTHMAAYYHECLEYNARQYLYHRGFTDRTIEDLQIGYCPEGTHPLYKDPIATESGLVGYNNTAFLANRIIFPYFKTKAMVTDLRGRTLDPDEELRYKSPHKSAYYRGAIYPYNYQLIEGAKKIIITEGEIKADISLQSGYITIGLPGILAWRSGFRPDEDVEVVIVFDSESNPDTQRDVIYAIRKIAREIYKPKIAVLPRIGNERKMEIDTFIPRFGVEMYHSIIDNALTYDQWSSLQAF